MANLTPQMIENARKIRDALDAALKVAESEAVDINELPELPEIELRIDPPARPSADVAEAVAESRDARRDFEAETNTRRTVALVLGVAAEVGRVLLPSLGPLLRLMPIVLLSLCIFGGCHAEQPRLIGGVQVGPTSRPAILARIESPINVESLVAATGGARSESTSQPVTVATRQQAGGDIESRQTTTTVYVSGSAWPIVAVVGLFAALILGVLYVRAQIRREAARRRELAATHNVERSALEYNTLERNALAVAKAITRLPPDSQERNRLLATIKATLPACDAWDDLLDRRGLRVRRSFNSGPAGLQPSPPAEPAEIKQTG